MNLRRSPPLYPRPTSPSATEARPPRAEPGCGADRSRKGTSGLLGGAACLVTTLHPERGLALALVQHLAEELPEVEFTLEERADIDAVWICGYDAGNGARVAGLRERHPHALLIVTSKAPEETWSGEVLAAGADHALSWPLDLAELARLLRRAGAA